MELHRLFPLTEIAPILNAVSTFRGYGHYGYIKPQQKETEIFNLAKMVYDKQPRSILEIGTHRGGTLCIWCRVSRQVKQVISVDLPLDINGNGYDPRRQKLYREFVADKPNTKMALFQVDSQLETTRDKVVSVFNGSPVDFLFIDADHRYEGVKRDFELYSPLVVPGGLIAFHDIIPNESEPSFGVDRFWRETRDRYDHFEFIENPQQGKMGIGVIVNRQ